MIYTLTFNPAIDYVMHAGNIDFGSTNRSEKEEIYFGGKGINVSVVLAELGLPSTALGFVGGFTGDALDAHLKHRGINTNFVRLAGGFTRINVKLMGEAETEINGAGPEIGEADLEKLYDKLDSLSEGDILLLAGSVPSSLPCDIYEKIMSRIPCRGIKFAVDASGELLTSTLKHKPFLIKPNKDELEGIFKAKLECDKDIIEAAKSLKSAGAVNVLVSLGGDGAILIDEFGEVHRRSAHRGKALNTVGAGDSMVAGFLAGIYRGYEYALKLGCAAGSATAFSRGLATRDDIEKLME